jgi:FAD/FMN-containing dehydrogenase
MMPLPVLLCRMLGTFPRLSMAIHLPNEETRANIMYSIASSSSVMQTYFANHSCDPFAAESSTCLLGNYVDYAVNVSSANDVIAAINFAKKNNIRFVIRNTGHE